MASQDSTTPFDPLQAIDLVRAALEPDERKFYKAYLGDETPGFSDWLAPQGRFRDARQLRGRITDMVVGEAFKQSQAPTVGNAVDMFPGMAMPKEATVMRPGPLLEAEGIDTLQGTQQVQIPSRMQGPMPGVMTALGDFTQRARNTLGDEGLSGAQVSGLDERQRHFYEESPRPLDTITVGQYGPEQAPSQYPELDRNMKLPPAFQSLLAANIHQKSLQPHAVQPHYPSAEERKYDDAMKFGVAAWMQEHPDQMPSPKDLHMIQQQATGAFEKAPLPGSNKERIEKANATITETTAQNAPRKQNVDMAKDYALTKHSEAQTTEIHALMDAHKKKLEAEAAQANMAGSKESLKAVFDEQRANMRMAEDLLKSAEALRKAGYLDEGTYAKLIDQMFQYMGTGLKATEKERSWFQKQFKTEPPLSIGERPPDESIQHFSPKLGQPTPPKMPQLNMQPMPQSAPQASLPGDTPVPKEDLSKAPAGKNKGDILKKGGKPVAKWDGSKWIPLE